MGKDIKYTSVKYDNYLKLNQILSAQKMRSEQVGQPAHDEMLFIIVHQVYELWFKEIIHDLKSIVKMFKEDKIDESNIGIAVGRLERVTEIQKLLIEQIRVMETMTPLDFLDFRNYLFPASGFQSFQFRVIEVILGLPAEQRITYNKAPYSIVFDEDERQQLEDLEKNSNMLKAIEDWLERTPFLEFKGFNFIEKYKHAVTNMIESEKTAIMENTILSDHNKEMRLKMMGDSSTYFQNIFDEDKHNELLNSGKLKFSYRATKAALLINLYRDEPILHLPFQLLQKLMDVDEFMTTWRYRHAQMVLRMLGKKVGTGGSSGHDYLNETARSHHIYTDLHNISTLMIPRSELPILPNNVKKELGFYYSSHRD